MAVGTFFLLETEWGSKKECRHILPHNGHKILELGRWTGVETLRRLVEEQREDPQAAQEDIQSHLSNTASSRLVPHDRNIATVFAAAVDVTPWWQNPSEMMHPRE